MDFRLLCTTPCVLVPARLRKKSESFVGLSVAGIRAYSAVRTLLDRDMIWIMKQPGDYIPHAEQHTHHSVCALRWKRSREGDG
jgi:hypothetical protein